MTAPLRDPTTSPPVGRTAFTCSTTPPSTTLEEIYVNGAYGTVTLDLGVPANPFGTPTMSVQSATGYFPFICGIDNPASTPVPVMELFTTPTTPNHCG